MLIFLSNMTDGERKTVEELYAAYKNRVYTIACHILRNREDAEDAVCETFMQIMKDIKYFSGRKCEDLDRLIVKYSRWTAINLYNKRKRHASGIIGITPDDDTDPLTMLADNADTPEEIAEAHDTAHAARRILDALPVKYRDPLIMRYYDEMKISDIAGLMGLTESAVNMRLARGKTMMEKKLREEGYFDEA